MHIISLVLQALVKIAWSPFATALAGGLIGYLAAGRGERATLREQRRQKQLATQAALRALAIEMFRDAELALSGSATVLSWGDPSSKTEEELKAVAQAYEGKIPFALAKYFRDRTWSKYEDIFVENLDSATLYTVDAAYSSARQIFDYAGAPLPQGATQLQPSLRYSLWRVASDLAKAIPSILDRLTDADERKQFAPRLQKLTSALESQSKVVNRI